MARHNERAPRIRTGLNGGVPLTFPPCLIPSVPSLPGEVPDFGRRRYKGFEDKHPFLKYEKIMKMTKRGRVRRRIRAKDSLASGDSMTVGALANKQVARDLMPSDLVSDDQMHLEIDTQAQFVPSNSQNLGIMPDLTENSVTEESNVLLHLSPNPDVDVFTLPETGMFSKSFTLSPEASLYSPPDASFPMHLDLSQSLDPMFHHQPLSMEGSLFTHENMQLKLSGSVDLFKENLNPLEEPPKLWNPVTTIHIDNQSQAVSHELPPRSQPNPSTPAKDVPYFTDLAAAVSSQNLLPIALPPEASAHNLPAIEFDQFLPDDNDNNDENLFAMNTSLGSLWNQDPTFDSLQTPPLPLPPLPLPTLSALSGEQTMQLENSHSVSFEQGESFDDKILAQLPKANPTPTPSRSVHVLSPINQNRARSPEKTGNALDPKRWVQEEIEREVDLDKLAREYYRLANTLPVSREEAEHDILDRPNKCPLCPRGYSQKGKLKAHILKCHPNNYYALSEYFPMKVSKEGKRYPCPVEGCMSGFSQVCSYNRHMRTVHPNFT